MENSRWEVDKRVSEKLQYDWYSMQVPCESVHIYQPKVDSQCFSVHFQPKKYCKCISVVGHTLRASIPTSANQGKIFLALKFSYLYFWKPSNETETGIVNKRKLLIASHLEQSL